MEDLKTKSSDFFQQQKEELNSLTFHDIYTAILLYWQWFILSILICVGCAFLYLRYKTPTYNSFAKMLIKDDQNNSYRGRNSLLYSSNLGTISNSNGIDNEMQILSSHPIAAQVVKDLKLYVTYKKEGTFKNNDMYKNQPINVDIDLMHLDHLKNPIELTITKKGNKYHVTGSYFSKNQNNQIVGPIKFNKTFSSLPASTSIEVGNLSFAKNNSAPLEEGKKLFVKIFPVASIANKYVRELNVSQLKETNIVVLSMTDEFPQLCFDYLTQLVECYNRQANEDKNEIAYRTEEFINRRLEKINHELGNTEGQAQYYKKEHNIVDLSLNAGQALQNQDVYDQKLVNANMQISLINNLAQTIQSGEKYQTLPVNIGINDDAVNSLVAKYNEIALERNRLLHSASESSPAVTPLTMQLDELSISIQRAMGQAKRNLEIQRGSVASQYNKYAGRTSMTPEYQRILGQIGLQQNVKSGLYLMLLQKREENSISLAATADKGKLIDTPQLGGQVSPKRNTIYLISLILGIGIPSLLIFLLRLLRYKIENHEDVAKLTNLPILADVAVASDNAKKKANIVIHENENNMMEEIYRSMRTNLLFTLKENEKVIMLTSTTSGEGKTFNAANLAVSFALLGKKTLLVGLDIRKPRLGELFEISNHKFGITNLLIHDNPTEEDLQKEILPSGINKNLELLLAGPIPPNPTELLSRKSLDVIFEQLKLKYDYIIIDTAPVGLVTDTLQIGRVADATAYVCRADYTPKESFLLINDLEKEKKLPKISLIINGIDLSKKKYGVYYGYGKYGKYARYGRYGKYASYKSYGSYSTYGNYAPNNHYRKTNDNSIKK